MNDHATIRQLEELHETIAVRRAADNQVGWVEGAGDCPWCRVGLTLGSCEFDREGRLAERHRSCLSDDAAQRLRGALRKAARNSIEDPHRHELIVAKGRRAAIDARDLLVPAASSNLRQPREVRVMAHERAALDRYDPDIHAVLALDLELFVGEMSRTSLVWKSWPVALSIVKLTRRECRFGKYGSASPLETIREPYSLAPTTASPSLAIETSTSRNRIMRASDATTSCLGRLEAEASAAMVIGSRCTAQSRSSSATLHGRALSMPTLQFIR